MAQKVFLQPSDVRVLIVEDVPVNQVVIGVHNTFSIYQKTKIVVATRLRRKVGFPQGGRYT